jgi:hypothetical protein
MLQALGNRGGTTMSKFVVDAAMDAGLAVIAAGTRVTFCSAAPANFAGIAAVLLASVTVTAGAGNGDFTIADGAVSGRKLTVGAQTGLVPAANGDVLWACVDNGTTLLSRTSVTQQAVTTTQTWDSPAFVAWGITDPV